jgi:phosphatidylinositol dimannoside acyltransferase
MTQQLARVLADGIAKHPQDWHMLQKVFVADLHAGRLLPASQQPPPAGQQRRGDTRPG